MSQSKSRLRIIFLAAGRDLAVKGDAPVVLLVDGCCAYPTQATKAISACSDVGGPFIDFVHCMVYHKSHVGSCLFISYSEQ